MAKKQRDKICPSCGKKYVSTNAAEKHLHKKHPKCTQPLVIRSQGTTTRGATKSTGKKLCKLCPHLPEFSSKAAKKKHSKTVHSTKCPMCLALLIKRPLVTHLWRVHGIRDGGNQIANQTVSQIASKATPTEPSYVTPVHWAPEFGYLSHDIAIPSNNNDFEGSSAAGVHDSSIGRFYCQEYDCGKGFSLEAHLNSHTRFFHPKKRSQIQEGEKKIAAPMKDTPGTAERSSEHPPAYFSPTSTLSSLSPREHATQEIPGPPIPAGPLVITPLLEWHQVTYSNVEAGIQNTFEGPVEPQTRSLDEGNVSPSVTASTTLSLRCRICNAPPTVVTRPTVTMCGHLFCSECVTQCVVETSKCPICDTALSQYCLFKLDLPVPS